MATLTADAARILGQLHANHAANTAAGLGGPGMDAFHSFLVELVTEATNPNALISEVTDLLTAHIRSAGPVGGAR
ncbi:hypothetical protein ACFV06_31580 [Streptomyces sp. NPDC059618]|uniref:hypothetical protein n=1 Tax=Streptomyces sp. NPDC059618 TaxID=3346887 RepID=UPI00367BA873